MKKYFKKKWLIGAGVLVLILLVIGITVPVLAAPGNNNTNNYSSNGYLDQPTLNRIAGVLGLTPADLSSQLQSGKTLAALAQEHNVTTAVLEDAIIAPYSDQVATQVKYGYLTQDQANTLLANARTRADSLIQQDLSANTGNNTANNNGSYGSCYNYMSANGYGPGSGWGGFMGPGMMHGWSGSNSNASGNSNNSPRGLGGFGRGGMMGGW